MSVTDELLSNNERYAESFDKGDLPLPQAKEVAVLGCVAARLDPARAQIQGSIRGFVYDVTTGRLREVTP